MHYHSALLNTPLGFYRKTPDPPAHVKIVNWVISLFYIYIYIHIHARLHLWARITQAWCRNWRMMAWGGSQMSRSRLRSQSQAVISPPGRQGATTTKSDAMPSGNRDAIPTRVTGDTEPRAALAWPSIIQASSTSIFPGGSLSVMVLYASTAKSKSIRTWS